MGSLVCPCCCCCYSRRCSETSALGGIVQLKSIGIEERPVWRLHWSVFSSQRDCVWQLTRFGGRKWRSGLNKISHPDLVKLSVELNLRAKQNTKFFPSLHRYVSHEGESICDRGTPTLFDSQFFFFFCFLLSITWSFFRNRSEGRLGLYTFYVPSILLGITFPIILIVLS